MRYLVRIGLSLLILLGGCGYIDHKRGPEQAKNEIEQYLEEKYGGSFCVLSIHSPRLLMDYDVCRAVREGADTKTDCFTVKRYRNQNKAGQSFEDDYFGLLIRADMEKAVRDLAALEGAETKVYIKQFIFPGFCDAFEKDDTLETVKAAGAVLDADYYIFLRAADLNMTTEREFGERTEALFAQMAKIVQPGLVRVFAMEEEAFEEIDRENCGSYLNDYYHADKVRCLALARRVVKADE